MSLHALSLASADLALARKALQDGAFIAQGALPPKLVGQVQQSAKKIFADQDYLRSHPHDPVTKTGYTPPGVEGTKATGPNFKRQFFDFGSVAPPELQQMRQHLLQLGSRVLTLVVAGAARTVPPPCQGNIRLAQYLNASIDPAEVLFPGHLDFSMLTFFVGGSSDGLEAELGGAYEPVAMGQGDVLVAAGTLLKQYWPEARPLRHRVMAGSVSRISMFMFLEPPPEAVLPSGERMSEFLNRILSGIRF